MQNKRVFDLLELWKNNILKNEPFKYKFDLSHKLKPGENNLFVRKGR